MHPIQPVTITTPDGVERPLRFTFGARRRIAEEFGCNLLQAFIKLDDSALPAALYCCMFDNAGLPPPGLTLKAYQETADSAQAVELMGKLREAMEQGAAPKNVLAVMDAAILMMQAATETTTGSVSGATPISVSASPSPNSGTSPNENLIPLPNDTANESAEPITALAS